jgi:hypothetical protein
MVGDQKSGAVPQAAASDDAPTPEFEVVVRITEDFGAWLLQAEPEVLAEVGEARAFAGLADAKAYAESGFDVTWWSETRGKVLGADRSAAQHVGWARTAPDWVTSVA